MKKRILGGCCIAAVIVIIIAAVAAYTNREKNINGITKYKWIQMLTEEFNTNEYTNEEPYFKDVTFDNSYFASVQAACEWEIIEKDSNFNGDEIADGEFIALTAMRAIGKYKIQIYLGLDNLPSEDDWNGVYTENSEAKRGCPKSMMT